MTTKERVVKTYDATGRELHVDVPMSNLVVNYRTRGLLADDMFPIVEVDKQHDMIPVIPLGEFLRSEAAQRAPGTEARKVKFGVGTKTYYAKNYALKYPLTVEDAANADRVWRLRENGAFLITDLINIGREIRVVNAVNSTSNVNTAYTVASAWSGAGLPLDNILTALYRVQDTTGFLPNNIAFGNAAWRSFRQNSTIRQLLFPHGGGLPTLAMAADLIGVERAFVATGYYSTAAENFAAALSPFMSDAVYAWFNPPGGQIGPLPRYSATFRWVLPRVPAMTVEVHPYDSRVKAEEIEVGVYDDEKVLDANLGVSILGVNSSQ